jgi:hypothetical protein
VSKQSSRASEAAKWSLRDQGESRLGRPACRLGTQLGMLSLAPFLILSRDSGTRNVSIGRADAAESSPPHSPDHSIGFGYLMLSGRPQISRINPSTRAKDPKGADRLNAGITRPLRLPDAVYICHNLEDRSSVSFVE